MSVVFFFGTACLNKYFSGKWINKTNKPRDCRCFWVADFFSRRFLCFWFPRLVFVVLYPNVTVFHVAWLSFTAHYFMSADNRKGGQAVEPAETAVRCSHGSRKHLELSQCPHCNAEAEVAWLVVTFACRGGIDRRM